MHTLASNHPIHLDLLRNDRHYAALVEKKRDVEDQISEEMGHSAVDMETVKALKLKKLKLNDLMLAYAREKATIH